MKKELFTLLCLFGVLSAFGANPKPATKNDLTSFGFKGKVESASADEDIDVRFDENGNISGTFSLFDLYTGKWTYNNTVVKRTNTGFVSSSDDFGDFTVTVANNKVTKMVFDHLKNDSKSIRTYTYDRQGYLSKVQETFTYFTEEKLEAGYNITGTDAYYRELEKLRAECQRKMLTMSPQEAQQWYDNAVIRLQNRLNGIDVNGYARVKKQKHVKTTKISYSNYVFDDFGNWVSRDYVKEEDGKTTKGVQKQEIKYESLFWSEFYWKKLEPEGNLRKIEAFVLNKNCHKSYQDIATRYWNEHILAEVKRVDNNNRDSLCHVAKSPIISHTNKEKVLNIVREDLYTNMVQPIRDYARVDDMKNMTYSDFDIFDDVYKKKIEQLSLQLRQDSITFLTNKANKEFEGKNYMAAERTCKGLLIIDPANSLAKEISQEANYQIVLAKEANNTVNENDYINFINLYSYSSHINELLDKRALYASNLFNRQTSGEELERVHNLQTVDKKVTKTVNKRYRKWMFKKNHGRFFRIGLGGEYGVGGANAIASGELGVRLGYTANLINGTIGIKYNYLTRTSSSFKKPKEAGNAFFERQYLSVPLMLRFNLKHGYHGSTYVGLGAELNVANLKTLLRDVNEDIKENEFAKKDMSLSPRIAFGGYLVGLEVELFATYDNENHFNKDYIETYQLNGQPVKNVCNEKSYQKQVEPKDFLDKIHGGLAIRLWF